MEDSEDRPHQNEADIYKRIKLLGSGSYGRAYLVQQKLTGQEWVIKQINLTDMTPQEQETALKEAKILEMLNHTNIVRFRQVYRTAKMKLNIVMEYAGGGDLSQRIKTAKETKMFFSQHQILDWLVQICLALRYIHSNKIIHRDLKAQNIFLTHDGLIKLGDFGVAKVLQHTAARARTVVGSPYYISPEIIENRPYSFKTDIWSLGTLLYQLCALQPPFKANNLQFLALKIVQGAPPALPKMYSQDLKWLVRSMLQTKESNRPSIHQIFSSKIITDTIKRLNDSPQINPRRISQISRTTTDFKKISTLKPPPNLLDVQIVENKSDIIQSKKMQIDEHIQPQSKAQTPQMNVRKGANNFFNQRPVTGRKKTAINNTQMDLADLIQIKPSVFEKHEKIQRPQVPLPPVPIKVEQANKVLSPQHKPPAVELKKMQKKPITPPATAFTKKRSSFAHQKIEKEEGLKIQVIKPVKPMTKRNGKAESKNTKGDKKPQIRKKTYNASKKQTGQIKLQVCSEQAKKSQLMEKKQLDKKKSEKKLKKPEKKKQRKIYEDETKEQNPIMEEEKCDSQLTSHNETDDYFSNYYGQDFEDYSEGSEGDDLTFSVTGNESNLNANFNFQKIILELNKIQKIVQAGQDIESSPDLGQSIPELLNFSGEIREDDNQLDSNHSTKALEVDPEPQKIDLGCLQTVQQLQILRVKLEDIFGTDNLVFAYNTIEEKLNENGLNFCEEAVMNEILIAKTQIDQSLLQRYFGHIVAIISREKQFL